MGGWLRFLVLIIAPSVEEKFRYTSICDKTTKLCITFTAFAINRKLTVLSRTVHKMKR